MTPAEQRRYQKIKDAQANFIAQEQNKWPGITAVGIGSDGSGKSGRQLWFLRVYFQNTIPIGFPSQYEGWPIKTRVTGDIRAHDH